MKNSFILFFVFLMCMLSSAGQKNWRDKTEKAAYIHRSIREITDVMVHDIYSPPVTSRIYAYSCIAGYEAAIAGFKDYITFAGQLQGLESLPVPRVDQEYSFTLASVYAILAVGKSLVISEEKIKLFADSLLREFKDAGIPRKAFDNSIAYGQQVADHILKWASGDHYKETRSLPKYAVTDDITWKPTPPGYMKAVEPHWNRMRTFVIDSAQQFKPIPATLYSHEFNSQFYKEAVAVHEIGLNLSEEQKEVANFWDCNPFKININGHVMYATKKISPGGHWMNIARLACQKTNAGIAQSLETYACLSITIADAFISCWDEKYRSRVVRPETYINQYIDGNWMPLLQTPPFPEYTSGHSVLSTASAQLLTKLFGENFSFTDSTELPFGLPARSFTSFKQAAAEAAISRFYGGIHYMPSIVNGAAEGEKVGGFIMEKLRTRKDSIFFPFQQFGIHVRCRSHVKLFQEIPGKITL